MFLLKYTVNNFFNEGQGCFTSEVHFKDSVTTTFIREWYPNLLILYTDTRPEKYENKIQDMDQSESHIVCISSSDLNKLKVQFVC